MKHCCICENEIASQDPAVLFIGERYDKKTVCENCGIRYERMTSSSDEMQRLKQGEYFHRCAKKLQDREVSEFLLDALKETGYPTVEEKTEEEDYSKTEADESGWIKLLRILCWVGVILGIISSIVFGVVLVTCLVKALVLLWQM